MLPQKEKDRSEAIKVFELNFLLKIPFVKFPSYSENLIKAREVCLWGQEKRP